MIRLGRADHRGCRVRQALGPGAYHPCRRQSSAAADNQLHTVPPVTDSTPAIDAHGLDPQLGARLEPARAAAVVLFINFCRLTDKSLREYDAARAELLNHLSVGHQFLIAPYLRGIDHMENCISAAHRAVVNAKALRARRIGVPRGIVKTCGSRAFGRDRHGMPHW